MARKNLGKISRVSLGNGGYQNCMFGLSLTFECSSGTSSDFYGTWPVTRDISDNAEWNKADQDKAIVEMVTLLTKTMKKAKVKDMYELIGIPVECTFGGQMLQSWRILEEVL